MNKDKWLRWKMDNLEHYKEYQKNYRNTKIGKASILLSCYKRDDEKHNRGECTLTKEWIVDNILSKPCVHCGETDWTKIGCNRLDNSKPHTIENVEPCCWECNNKLGNIYKSKIVYQYTLDGELVATYCSANEAARQTGFCTSGISLVCNGKLKTYKGYIWKYIQV